MRKLNFELIKLCNKAREGSFSTHENRKKILFMVANQLNDLGFRNMIPKSLKSRHVEALLNHWSSSGLSSGTIKNRMSVIRWWADKVGKPGVVAKKNDHYGIQTRQYVTNQDKSKILDKEKLKLVKNEYVQMSLRLQESFGLRREESIKIIPDWADHGDYLLLKHSWTKGGKERLVPIRTEEQRALLEEAKKLTEKGALIPRDKKYVDQLRVYEYQTAKVGLNKMHGLRHCYAQARYLELTGKESPAKGGEKPISQEEKATDKKARQIISKELGHEREEVSAVYLGRL